MILADKIIKLRKKCGWSQEELAEKMNVSRQSISKWEGAASIPDLNKIIQLSQIFGVTTDYLLKEDITDEVFTDEDLEEGYTTINLAETTIYIETKVKFATMVGRGVILCIYALIPLFLLTAFMDSETWLTQSVVAGIGVPVMLLLVAWAVTIFVRASRFFEENKKIEEGTFELEYGVAGIMKERAEENKNRFYMKLPIAVGALIISTIPLIVAGTLEQSERVLMLMLVLMFVIIGGAVYALIAIAITKESYDRILHDGPYSVKYKKENEKVEKFASIYWPLVVAVYLGWSFVTMDWGLTWVVWPVAALVFAGLSGFFSNRD